ncbi:helix-turn-helix transcriptional regulator [Pandoraea terrae]|uniref:Helix-turn-helix transcriptional regulator n=1 Tax=Pandoraea terrae TaxID=1537710 RepID=A0A5E4TYL1_9BURK|nr:PAS domain-containing protein [Pandoraea terrae]VVD90959.1 helix-turn-helix transcriptional regulator [Pandoraea terrae]
MNDKGNLSLDPLIGKIYDGVLDEAVWTEALQAFNRLAGGIGYHALTWDRVRHCATAESTSIVLPGDRMKDFTETLAPKDPRVNLILQESPGHAMRCHEFLSERYVAGSDLFNEFLIPNGVRYTYGMHLHAGPVTSEIVGIMRAPDHRPFESDDEAPELQILMQHFSRAARLRAGTQAWQAQAALGMAALDQLDLAILVADEKGQTRYLNQAAHQLLGESRSLRLRQGRIEAFASTDQNALQQLLALASGPVPTAGSHRIRHDEHRKLVVSAIPLRPDHPAALAWQRPMVMLTVADLMQRTTLTPYTLKALFGLSPAEARLALALYDGKELAQIAEEAGVAINTARTQLRNIFDKTGSRRQADLVRLLNAIPAVRS